MSHTARLPFSSLAPTSLNAMINLSKSVSQSSIGERLFELVNLRVSQINGCGVCVDMHWRFLLTQGAALHHLNAIAGWREAPFFSERERAALAWGDAVNALPHGLRLPPSVRTLQRNRNRRAQLLHRCHPWLERTEHRTA